MNELKEFIKTLGVNYKDISYYQEAFTHRSFLNEKRDNSVRHNERLEFLGDAVLELIITQHLFSSYPDRPEGELTSFRAAIVRTDSLAKHARNLGYGKYLMMSKGEEATGGKDKDYLLANTYEAVLGAIYLDLGYKEAQSFVKLDLIPDIEDIVNNRLDIDSKTKFQEIAQALYKVTPIYQVISEEGPDHDKIFTMAVMINEKELGRGKGPSKQKAEEEAASMALKVVQHSK